MSNVVESAASPCCLWCIPAILHLQRKCLVPVWIERLLDGRGGEGLPSVDGDYGEGVRQLELYTQSRTSLSTHGLSVVRLQPSSRLTTSRLISESAATTVIWIVRWLGGRVSRREYWICITMHRYRVHPFHRLYSNTPRMA